MYLLINTDEHKKEMEMKATQEKHIMTDKTNISIGSDNQIAWANDIIAEFYKEFDQWIDSAKDRVSRGNMPKKWEDHVSIICTLLLIGGILLFIVAINLV